MALRNASTIVGNDDHKGVVEMAQRHIDPVCTSMTSNVAERFADHCRDLVRDFCIDAVEYADEVQCWPKAKNA